MHQRAERLRVLDETLAKVPYQYAHQQRLRGDVAALLQDCSTLKPGAETFSANGRQVKLFYLYGVLPITYRGNAYNIPVTIYFDPPYPAQGPRCFVTPTTGMAIKPNHSSVDAGGMIYVPYLSSWTSQGSNLRELIAILTSIFSSDPPVHSTGSASTTPYAQPAQPVATVAAQPVQPVATVVATPVVARPQPDMRDILTNEVTALLQERWSQVVEPLSKELEEQLARRSELEKASEALEIERANLKEAVEKADRQGEELGSVAAELRTSVEAEAGREDPEPDKVMDSMDADKRQVLDCVAEEMACDELLAAFDELLGQRKISLDDFMREVRDVSRRQFMCKMIRQKATRVITDAEQAAVAA
eukprot:TRINITY_DN36271_c0_g1_i1.p1 TRINITY_DN36271_c0_g1~~TRINITY_DN36271_c0_g1_i1.p1  ORF type:complete len:361 (-),score=67.03 TRINITY_DN36271_c0_g1_i1:62-1144(-)